MKKVRSKKAWATKIQIIKSETAGGIKIRVAEREYNIEKIDYWITLVVESDIGKR